MSRCVRSVFLLSPLAALACGWLVASAASPAPPKFESARLETFAKPEGELYFSLSLHPNVPAPANAPHDIVVLFETSASQSGAVRTKGLETLAAMLAKLSADDRVCLLASDLNAVPMTESFVAPKSAEMAQGLKKLHARVPLGANDLPNVFDAATERLSSSKRAKSVIYIGNGRSNANVAANGEVRQSVEKLVKNQISVTTFATGADRDLHLLAVVANHTGGMFLVDGDKVTALDAGNYLATSAVGSVLWPTKATFPQDMAVYPRVTPPLRFDRDSIVVGKGAVGEMHVEMTTTLNGQTQELRWDVKATKPNNALAYLPQIVDPSKADGGFALPTVGSEGLSEVQRMMASNIDSLNKVGGDALNAGNLAQADQILRESLRRDPNNAETQTLIKNLEKARQPGPKAGVIRLMAYQKPQPGDAVGGESIPAPGSDGAVLNNFQANNPDSAVLQTVEERMKIMTQMIQSEVRNELEKSRTALAGNPRQAKEDLKLLQSRVRKVAELEADVRSQLETQIETMIRESDRRVVEKDARDLEARIRDAQNKERERAISLLNRTQEREKQLFDRFNSLMVEGRLTDDLTKFVEAQDVVIEARNIDYNGTVPFQAVTFSYFAHDYLRQRQIREASIRGFIDEMAAVEKSHIPFRDDVPIVYPSAQRWAELTEQRKQWRQGADVKDRGPAERKILEELDRPSKVEFLETPLKEAMDFISDQHGINVQLDNNALKEAGIDIATPITLNLKGLSLRSILRLLLKEQKLTYVIDNEVLLITTLDEAAKRTTTKVYPVADLVLPINNGAGANPFSLGGGLGGQGAFGGGLGGGQANPAGGGGGGGGFGGGLGGGGGGAAFNLPDLQRIRKGLGGLPAFNLPELPPANDNGFRAFAVADEGAPNNTKTESSSKIVLKGKPVVPAAVATPEPKSETVAANTVSISPTTEAAAPAAKAAKPPEAKPQMITFAPKPGVDLLAAWSDYFDAHAKVRPADLRETVRQLLAQKKFDQITAMLQAALRSGHGQPWMYEALGLAMQLSSPQPPKEDIERVLMSAADFASSPNEIMFLATYMQKLGFDKRALKLYRQVALLDPTLPTAYVKGLELAKNLNDIDGIKWACTGVLSRDWPARHKDLEAMATFVAAATKESLIKQNRAGEAAEFQAALDAAGVRDVRFEIHWTGDADVDVFVEEPTGSVCSSRNPITPAGGILLGDSFARSSTTTPPDGYSETYVCPEGFNGTYRVLIRRVWGKVAAGTVTIDIYTHHHGEKEKHIRHQIPLEGSDDKLVLFSLEEGRRTEPVAQAQVANTIANQIAQTVLTDRVVMAQQLAQATDPNAAANLAAARQNQLLAGGFPFNRAGAVGYMPIIITLPTGVNLTATGVVSADRRYVRITAVPLVSDVPEVSTFNFVTGNAGMAMVPGLGGM